MTTTTIQHQALQPFLLQQPQHQQHRNHSALPRSAAAAAATTPTITLSPSSSSCCSSRAAHKKKNEWSSISSNSTSYRSKDEQRRSTHHWRASGIDRGHVQHQPNLPLATCERLAAQQKKNECRGRINATQKERRGTECTHSIPGSLWLAPATGFVRTRRTTDSNRHGL
jgi:hypothetical protein